MKQVDEARMAVVGQSELQRDFDESKRMLESVNRDLASKLAQEINRRMLAEANPGVRASTLGNLLMDVHIYKVSQCYVRLQHLVRSPEPCCAPGQSGSTRDSAREPAKGEAEAMAAAWSGQCRFTTVC